MRYYKLEFSKDDGLSWQTLDSLNPANPNALRVQASYPINTDNTISVISLIISNEEKKFDISYKTFAGQLCRFSFGIWGSPFGSSIKLHKPVLPAFTGIVYQQLPQIVGFQNDIVLKIVNNSFIITNDVLSLKKGVSLFAGLQAWFISNGVPAQNFTMSTDTISTLVEADITLKSVDLSGLRNYIYTNYQFLMRIVGNDIYISKSSESYLAQPITTVKTNDIIGNPSVKATTSTSTAFSIAQLQLICHARSDIQVLDYINLDTQLPVNLTSINTELTVDMANMNIESLTNASGIYQVITIMNNIDTRNPDAEQFATSYLMNKVG